MSTPTQTKAEAALSALGLYPHRYSLAADAAIMATDDAIAENPHREQALIEGLVAYFNYLPVWFATPGRALSLDETQHGSFVNRMAAVDGGKVAIRRYDFYLGNIARTAKSS